MGGHPFPETQCTICAKPVDLAVDLSADENGKSVHQDCYVKRLMSSKSNPPSIVMPIKFNLNHHNLAALGNAKVGELL